LKLKKHGLLIYIKGRSKPCPAVPHRNAVESQEAKTADLEPKGGMMSWIGMAA
jgi:hypothetical protein